MSTPAAFSALRHRNYQLFFSGQAISLIGSWMQMTAQGWLVTLLAGSEKEASAAQGWVTTLGSLPMLLGAFYGGWFADRFSKHKIVLWAQVAQGLLALGMAALVYAGQVQLWHVAVFATLLGVTNVFDIPARQAFIVELVGKEDLHNAIGLNSSLFNAARVLGPMVAGFLIADKERAMAPCFLANGLSYLAVILGLCLMRGSFAARATGKEAPLKGVKEALGYLRQHQPIVAMMAILAGFSIFMAGDWILLPTLAKYALGADATRYSQLMSARGVGALLGALTCTLLSSSPYKGRLVTVGAVLFPLFSLGTALCHSLQWAFLFAPLSSFCMICVFATSNSLLQASVPDALRGRVMGVHAFLMMGLTPLGSAWAGLVASRTSTASAMALGAGLAASCALLAVILSPGLRRARQTLVPEGSASDSAA
ncbi:MFS transporter [Armatimonas rosea]|uniref:MFS family permease n=1 Tax=Armatimonas rosea TaxID=685828 RepID=A0A7W9W4V6_ARMRO|nr:MFS family permease [Armatimonas rosea]